MRHRGWAAIVAGLVIVCASGGAATARAAVAAKPPGAHAAAAKRTAAAKAPAAAPAIPARDVAKPTGPQPDFTLYQQLLDELLTVSSAKGQPFETRFNYEKWYDEKDRDARMGRIRAAFLAVSPRAMDAPTREAWAINFYNYLILDEATTHLLIPGKFRTRVKSVQEIRLNLYPFFEGPVVTVDSVEYSFNTFEKRFVFAGFDRAANTTPPPALDPRVHFAIVCGAIGCPALMPNVYRPESLDVQIDRAVRDALVSPRHYVHRTTPYLFQLSAIFNWYAIDFGGPRGVIAWLQKYVSKPESQKLAPYLDRPIYGQIDWDWNLNQTLGWRYLEQMKAPLVRKKAVADST